MSGPTSPHRRERPLVTEYNGAAVQMAVGVLMERHNLDAAQAMDMLTSAAFTAGRSVGALAVEILDGARHGDTDDQAPG